MDKLVDYSKINIESEIQRYIPNDNADFIAYISNASLKKDIHALYGIIRGFTLDSEISKEENPTLSGLDSDPTIPGLDSDPSSDLTLFSG